MLILKVSVGFFFLLFSFLLSASQSSSITQPSLYKHWLTHFFSLVMNYVSVVYAVVVMIVFVDWFARGGRHFRTQAERHEHIEATFS